MFTRGTPTFGYFWKQPIKTKHSITIQVIQYEISSYLFPELSSPGNSAILWSVGHHHRGLNPPCTVSCPVCLPGELCWLPRDVSWCTRTGRGHPTPICNGCRLFLGQHNTHQLKLLKKNRTNIFVNTAAVILTWQVDEYCRKWWYYYLNVDWYGLDANSNRHRGQVVRVQDLQPQGCWLESPS